MDVESVHLNVEPSILHAEIIVPTYDIPTQAIENNIPANNIPAPANETVIRNPACPMTRLFKRMAEYRKAKNASRAQLCLGPVKRLQISQEFLLIDVFVYSLTVRSILDVTLAWIPN